MTAIGSRRYQKHLRRRLGWCNGCWGWVCDGQASERCCGGRSPGAHRSVRDASSLPPWFSGETHRSQVGVNWQPQTPSEAKIRIADRKEAHLLADTEKILLNANSYMLIIMPIYTKTHVESRSRSALWHT